MDLKKTIVLFFSVLSIGFILNFTNFKLSVGQIFGTYFWLGSLISGSFLGAFVLKKAKLESLISFSMPFALLVSSWAAWLFIHIAPVNILPLTLMGGGLACLYKLDSKIVGKVLVYNACFIFIFWLLLILNSFHPEIYWGEKPMDFNLLNFMGRNTSFPPEDPWLWGSPMKYYYFGYFMFGKLGPSMGLLGSTTYHLSLATSAGFFFLGGVSLMRSLGHRFGTALKGSALLFFATSIGGWIGYLTEGKKGANAFWASTRVFENQGFAEYPFWSFIFGDLHPHVMSYPFALFALTLLLRVALGEKRNPFSLGSLVLGFSVASLAALNAWDFIFMAFLFTLVFIFSGKKVLKQLSTPLGLLMGGVCWSPILLSLVGGGKRGISLYGGEHNSMLNYLQHQGLWWLVMLAFLILHRIEKREKRKFTVILFGSFLIILGFTEFFVFIDRMNTIFKFGNQLFILLGVISLSLYRDEKTYNYILYTFLGLFICSALFDQLNSNKYNAFGTARPTLNGTDFMRKVAREDYSFIRYLNQEVSGTPLILEAPGKSFENNKSRISAQTGLPTYLGWEGHVIIRGGSPRLTLMRKKEIDGLYKSTDALKSYEWLKKRGIQYVVVGGAEHAKYEEKGLAKFEQFVDLFLPLVQTKKGSKTFGLYKVGK